MKLNIKPCQVRIFEPFAVFLIILVVGANFVIPLVCKLVELNDNSKSTIKKLIWLLAVVCGLVYSLIVLRFKYSGSSLDRLLYFVLAAIFVILAYFTFYIP